MDKAAKTKRARQIGRMTYEQVRPLFEEAMKQREARRGCPECHYNTGPNWHYCEVRKALVAANKGRITSAVVSELRVHQEACPDCFIESYWKEFEGYCERCQEISDLFYLYAHRLQHIETKKLERRFQVAHGRKHTSVLELVEWQDQQ